MNGTQVIAQTDLLEVAGNMLSFHDNKDRLRPGMLELMGISQHGIPTVSGLNDYDYQHLSILASAHKPLTQMRTVNKSSIPNEILEHFKHIKCHCTMGLFPEIGRAWLTIDSEIYIWTYEQARDVAYYDGLSQLIVSVGLVKPKQGVFVKDVKYLLLLTTPIEIVVLGVTFGPTSNTLGIPERRLHNTSVYDEMQLMNKPIFVLSTDSVSISVVQGSKDGRIFLGGRDGCLYEIFYQAESSWFGKRCKKINLSQSIVSYMMPNFLKVFTETDPIERITIDDSRNLLYLLTEKGSIEAWDMGTNYTTMRRLGKITQNEIVQSATNIVKTMDSAIFRDVKALCPLSADDCSNLHLLAITQSGVRLYFTTVALNVTQYNADQPQFDTPPQSQCTTTLTQKQQYAYGQHQSSQKNASDEIHLPTGLFLLHVRLPPGYTPNTTIHKPKQVHSAHYDEGTLLLITTQQQEQDVLWSISSAPFPKTSYLVESPTAEPLDGIVWSVADVRSGSGTRYSNRSLLQKARIPKKVALLTNQGTHIMALLKPVDLLCQLLIACNGPHHESIKKFFQIQTELEACVTCLLIVTSDEYLGTEVATSAVQAFMLYGGEPCFQHQLAMAGNQQTQMTSRHLLNTTMGGNISCAPTAGYDRQNPQMIVSTPMPNSGIGSTSVSNPTMQHSVYPLSPIGQHQSSFASGIPLTNDNGIMVYSAKHDGLYLYVARMLRPIWQLHCVNDKLCSTLTSDDCKQLLCELSALRSFLEANSVHDLSSTIHSAFNNQTSRNNGYYSIIPGNNNFPMNEQQNATEQAHTEEKRSLTALNYFIKHCCEIISLWIILNEHQFQFVASQLTPEQQNYLLNSTFRDLTLTRSDICVFLIISLINSYLKDNASVSAISTALRESCPNLYRHEDAVTYKATEILMSAKTKSSDLERKQKLRTALQMCKDAAPTLPLHSICQQFTLAEFYEGVIELTATCAAKSDPEELGIHYYKNEEPAEDREGYGGFAARMSCYKEVRQMLDHVFQTLNANRCVNQDQNKTNYLNNTLPESLDLASDGNDTSNEKIMKIVRQALSERDPLLHVSIYEWLLSHEMLCELLNLVEPTLGEFLRRNAARSPDNINLIDLLWKYYEKNGHHSQAARILDNLAVTRSNNIVLDQRIEYLVRAVMCMRNESVGSSVSNGIFLKELEDKLDIARVQKAVLNDMLSLSQTSLDAAKVVQELNSALYDITQLYQDFAEPFQLWECQLTILNCSHHNDPLLIESVWRRIIDKATDGNGTSYERSTRLFTKIETLQREFGEAGHCFPCAYIIRELEIKACQMRLPEGIVPEKLIAMNMDIEIIMEYYARMISMNERVWSNEGNEWHLVQSAIRVVTLLATNIQTIYYRSKRRTIGKGQDIVAICLNICYQKPGTEHMQQSLKELQCQLSRLINS